MSMSLQLNTALVTFPEKEQIKLQTDDSYWAEENRILSCYGTLDENEQREVVVELRNEIIKNIGLGITASVSVGAPAFGFFGLVVGGIPGLIGGLKLGATLGVAGGIADGAIIGIREVKVKFMSSDKYKQWVEQARKTDVYPVYKKIIESDIRFDDFMCHFTSDLICIPVRAPDGIVYEQANISQWIKIKENQLEEAIKSGANQEKIDSLKETFSPVRAKVKSFTIEDLRYHPNYFEGLDKLAKIKISEMENMEEKRIFQEAMKAILSCQRENRKQIIKMQIAEITMYVANNDLDFNISKNVCKKLMEEIKKIEQEEKENPI